VVLLLEAHFLLGVQPEKASGVASRSETVQIFDGQAGLAVAAACFHGTGQSGGTRVPSHGGKGVVQSPDLVGSAYEAIPNRGAKLPREGIDGSALEALRGRDGGFLQQGSP
jgi:hypothetical protein